MIPRRRYRHFVFPRPGRAGADVDEAHACERARAHLHSLATRAKDTFAERFSLERYRSEVLQVVRGDVMKPQSQRRSPLRPF